MGPSTSTPGGFRRLTQCHAVMESASHHRNPKSYGTFPWLGRNQASKAGKPHWLSWVFQYLWKTTTGGSHPETLPLESKGKNRLQLEEKEASGVSRDLKILEVKFDCSASHLVFEFVLAAIIWITAPLRNDQLCFPCVPIFFTNKSVKDCNLIIYLDGDDLLVVQVCCFGSSYLACWHKSLVSLYTLSHNPELIETLSRWAVWENSNFRIGWTGN